MPTRTLEISDTHLAPVHTHFQSSLEHLLEWMAESPPDLVIVTGGLSLDGTDQEVGDCLADDVTLDTAVAGVGDRVLAPFPYKPLFQHRLDDTVVNDWAPLQPARDALAGASGGTKPPLVASGQLHQWRDHAPDGLRQIGASPVSFIVGEDRRPSIGSKLIGLAGHVLHEDGTHDCRLLLPARPALTDLLRLLQLHARPAAAA